MKTGSFSLIAAAIACALSLAAGGAVAQEPRPAPPPPAGMGQPGMGQPGMRMERHAQSRPRFSAADRAAFFDAHLAGLHAGLKLTPEQDKLWPPVEAALRAGAKNADEREQRGRDGQRPANAIAWLRQLSADDIAKGETLKALADAAAPLYDSLSEEQRRRLPFLMHGIRPHGAEAMHPDDEDAGDDQ